jgi:hypothetical protein
MADSGPRSQKCVGFNSVGEPCKAWAVLGMDVCWYHGGRAAGQEVRTRARLRASVEVMTLAYGGPVEVDPAQALLDEVARTNGHIQWLQNQILTSDPQAFGEMAWRRAENANNSTRTIRPEDQEAIPSAYTGVWLDLYIAERKHLLTAADKAIKAGVVDRMVRLQESQGVALAMVLARILDRLQLSEEQRDVAAEVVATELRSLTASAPPAEGEVVARG